MRFRDKVALISAAANGIGRATATIMTREGATVIAVDNHQGRLDEAVPALRQAGSKAGGKVKVIWYTGGHDGGKPGPELRGEMIDWFDFHLRHQGSDPGAGFEYAVQGALRVQGAPFERGFQHGYLVAAEYADAIRTYSAMTLHTTGMDYAFFVREAATLQRAKVPAELLQALRVAMRGDALGWREVRHRIEATFGWP